MGKNFFQNFQNYNVASNGNIAVIRKSNSFFVFNFRGTDRDLYHGSDFDLYHGQTVKGFRNFCVPLIKIISSEKFLRL